MIKKFLTLIESFWSPFFQLRYYQISRNKIFEIWKIIYCASRAESLHNLKPLKKSGIPQTCHSALDTESNINNNLEIPACAAMTFLMIYSKISIYKKVFVLFLCSTVLLNNLLLHNWIKKVAAFANGRWLL